MHPKQQVLEDQLRLMCDDLDTYLENKYGQAYPLHPNRPRRGKAAAVSYDGLFSTGTQFTMGYGSAEGRGYIIDIDICTLKHVKDSERAMIEEDATTYLKALLLSYFPQRKLEIVKDGNLFKIIGDFSLGKL